MEEIYLPALNSLMNGNVFTGSSGALRFKITPSLKMLSGKDVDAENSTMKAEYWHGIFCYEKSSMEGEREFPISETGRQDMLAWLASVK